MEKQINIILQRVRSTRYGLDGELFINNIKICDTVENTAYCLDEGEYKIELKKCKHHLRHMPVIMIKLRIHSGNTVKDTKGYILVGWNMERGRHLLHGTFLDINQEKAENCTKNEIFLAVFVHNAYLCSS